MVAKLVKPGMVNGNPDDLVTDFGNRIGNLRDSPFKAISGNRNFAIALMKSLAQSSGIWEEEEMPVVCIYLNARPYSTSRY